MFSNIVWVCNPCPQYGALSFSPAILVFLLCRAFLQSPATSRSRLSREPLTKRVEIDDDSSTHCFVGFHVMARREDAELDCNGPD